MKCPWCGEIEIYPHNSITEQIKHSGDRLVLFECSKCKQVIECTCMLTVTCRNPKKSSTPSRLEEL